MRAKLDIVTALRVSSAKVRAIAHLLGNQPTIQDIPLDQDDIYLGLEEILTEISQNLKEMAITIEETELKIPQRKNSSISTLKATAKR